MDLADHRPLVFNFSYVCQLWRNVALAVPGIWCFIPLRYQQWATAMLERSRSAVLVLAPLYLSLRRVGSSWRMFLTTTHHAFESSTWKVSHHRHYRPCCTTYSPLLFDYARCSWSVITTVQPSAFHRHHSEFGRFAGSQLCSEVRHCLVFNATEGLDFVENGFQPHSPSLVGLHQGAWGHAFFSVPRIAGFTPLGRPKNE